MGHNELKLTLIADLHGWLPNLPGGDMLIIAGDFCPIQGHSLERQKKWVDQEFRQWLSAQPYRNIIGIAGNHDFVAQDPEGQELLRGLPWNYLQDQSVWLDGLRVWGSPWCAPCGNWAFMAKEQRLQEIWQSIPDDTNLIITHSPAHGWGDRVMSGKRVGSESLHRRLTEIKPALHVHGHIHEGRGLGRISNKVHTINASLLDERYDPWNWCWTADLALSEYGWILKAWNEEPIPPE